MPPVCLEVYLIPDLRRLHSPHWPSTLSFCSPLGGTSGCPFPIMSVVAAEGGAIISTLVYSVVWNYSIVINIYDSA